ncbi:MAG: archease [Candidatus Nanohaloarchaea archaeon]
MYEILSHTADEKFRAEGKSLEEAFSRSVEAFAEIVGADPDAGEYRHSLNIESEKLESLLFDFLDRLIFLQETEGVVVCHAEDIEIEEMQSGHSLEATVWADPITEGASYQDVKAPTYNEMKVDYEKGEGWIIEAVLDI